MKPSPPSPTQPGAMRPAALLLWALLLTPGITPEASAAVIYSNLKDLAIPTGPDGVFLDLDTGDTVSIADTWEINPFAGGFAIGNSTTFQPVRVGTSNLDAVLNLAPGSVISSSLTYASGFGGSGNVGHEHIGAGPNQFTAGSDGYLGFRFTDAEGTHNGWMRLNLTNNTLGGLIRDWAYESGTDTISVGRVTQSVPQAGAQTVTLSPAALESFILGSSLSNTGGNTNHLLKTGGGSTTLSTSNSFTGSTTISGGTLELAGGSSLSATSSISLNGGTLLLSGGAGNRINDSAGVTLTSGVLNTGGLSESLGTLTLAGNSTIDFGSGASQLTFSSAGSTAWSGNLSVWNWTGTVGSGGGTDRLLFSSNTGNGNISPDNVEFYSGAGSGFLGFGGLVNAGTELVPVPEPAALGGAIVLYALIALRRHR